MKCQAFFMLNISQVILVRTDSNLCRKEFMVHWSAPNSLIRSYLQPCTNSMWGDESEAMAPIVWLYQTVDAQKVEVSFPNLLITLRRYANLRGRNCPLSAMGVNVSLVCSNSTVFLRMDIFSQYSEVINSINPRDSYMHHWPGSPLTQVMA